MKREVGINFFNFEKHNNYKFPDCFTLEIYEKGMPRKSGAPNKYNSIYIDYIGEISDSHDYGERIKVLIDALGGEETVTQLISKYSPERASVSLGIPVKYSEWNEDGSITPDILQMLGRIGVTLQIYYR